MSAASLSAQSESAAPVVVGVDGSIASLSAVELAAQEAQLRHRRLHIVHAFIWPYFNVRLEPSPTGPSEGGLRHAAEGILAEASERAQANAPGLVVTIELTTGAPAPVLLHHASTAALVVLGNRGLGGFSGLLVGSVAVQLAAFATCPILISRGRKEPAGPIVLGVDGSPANNRAVGYAFELAALHGAPLTALHAWEAPDMPLTPVDDPRGVQSNEIKVLADALAGWKAKYPSVNVESVVEHGNPRKALISASKGARVVVVGTRGRGGFAGLLLGSVSQAVLHHAACPVMMVPHQQSAGDPTTR